MALRRLGLLEHSLAVLLSPWDSPCWDLAQPWILALAKSVPAVAALHRLRSISLCQAGSWLGNATSNPAQLPAATPGPMPQDQVALVRHSWTCAQLDILHLSQGVPQLGQPTEGQDALVQGDRSRVRW